MKMMGTTQSRNFGLPDFIKLSLLSRKIVFLPDANGRGGRGTEAYILILSC